MRCCLSNKVFWSISQQLEMRTFATVELSDAFPYRVKKLRYFSYVSIIKKLWPILALIFFSSNRNQLEMRLTGRDIIRVL